MENSEGEESRGSSSPEERRTRTTRSRSEVRWRGSQKQRRWSSVSRLSGKQEKDRRDQIERDNQILLRKILDCHHGHDRERTSGIPAKQPGRGEGEMGRIPLERTGIVGVEQTVLISLENFAMAVFT